MFVKHAFIASEQTTRLTGGFDFISIITLSIDYCCPNL